MLGRHNHFEIKMIIDLDKDNPDILEENKNIDTTWATLKLKDITDKEFNTLNALTESIINHTDKKNEVMLDGINITIDTANPKDEYLTPLYNSYVQTTSLKIFDLCQLAEDLAVKYYPPIDDSEPTPQ